MVATITTAGNATYTVDEVAGGMILRDPNGASRTDTTPSAAQFVALWPTAMNLGIPCFIRNASNSGGTENISLAAGVGVTLSPASIVFSKGRAQSLLVHVDNVTPGSEAVTIYSLYDTTF